MISNQTKPNSLEFREMWCWTRTTGDSSQSRQTSSGGSTESGIKRQPQQLKPDDVGGAKKKTRSANDSKEMRTKAVESFADKVAAGKLVIVQLELPDTKLTEIAQDIMREIGCPTLKEGQHNKLPLGIRSCVCQLHQKRNPGMAREVIQGAESVPGTKLWMGPALCLLHSGTVSTFVPGYRKIRHYPWSQISERTKYWPLNGRRRKIIHSWSFILKGLPQKLKALSMGKFLGCKGVTFKVEAGKECPH